MPNPLVTQAIARASRRLPVLKQLPMMRLILLGEVVLLARTHIEKLTPKERRRLVVLMKDARGRPNTLPIAKRNELEALIAKAEPRLFAHEAAGKVSPVPLPSRLTRPKK